MEIRGSTDNIFSLNVKKITKKHSSICEGKIFFPIPLFFTRLQYRQDEDLSNPARARFLILAKPTPGGRRP